MEEPFSASEFGGASFSSLLLFAVNSFLLELQIAQSRPCLHILGPQVGSIYILLRALRIRVQSSGCIEAGLPACYYKTGRGSACSVGCFAMQVEGLL